MAEPEGLLIDGARLASAGARELWYRMRPPGEPPAVALDRVRRRLELLLGALFGEPAAIAAIDGEPPPTWLARLFGRAPRHLTTAEPLAATDGRRVWLPRAIELRGGGDEVEAIERYRLLAVEQAMRAVLGFNRAGRDGLSRIERDLYWIAEGAAVDRQLARDLPGLVPALRAARAAALAARPASRRLTEVERAVESLVRRALAAKPHAPPLALAAIDTPERARAWAGVEASRLGAGRFRGIARVALWGAHRPPATADPRDSDAPRPSSPRSPVRT